MRFRNNQSLDWNWKRNPYKLLNGASLWCIIFISPQANRYQDWPKYGLTIDNIVRILEVNTIFAWKELYKCYVRLYKCYIRGSKSKSYSHPFFRVTVNYFIFSIWLCIIFKYRTAKLNRKIKFIKTFEILFL